MARILKILVNLCLSAGKSLPPALCHFVAFSVLPRFKSTTLSTQHMNEMTSILYYTILYCALNYNLPLYCTILYYYYYYFCRILFHIS